MSRLLDEILTADGDRGRRYYREDGTTEQVTQTRGDDDARRPGRMSSRPTELSSVFTSAARRVLALDHRPVAGAYSRPACRRTSWLVLTGFAPDDMS
jgi:hypothetical protein